MNSNYKTGLYLGLSSCFFYALMDVFTKLSLDTAGLTFFNYYLYVNIFALIILTPYIIYQFIYKKVSILFFKSKMVFVVIICSMLSFSGAFLALPNITLDVFYSIIFTTPIFTTLIGIFVLKEELNKEKIIKLIIGFIGILCVINPKNLSTNNINFSSICLTFMIVFCDVASGIINRKYLSKERAITIRYYLFSISALTAIVMILLFKIEIIHLNFQQTGLSFCASMCMILAALGLTKAYQLAPASLIASTYYTFIIWAVVFGYVIFNNIPTISTVLGCLLILVSNLNILKKRTN